MWLINNENRHNIELPPLMGMSHVVDRHKSDERGLDLFRDLFDASDRFS